MIRTLPWYVPNAVSLALVVPLLLVGARCGMDRRAPIALRVFEVGVGSVLACSFFADALQGKSSALLAPSVYVSVVSGGLWYVGVRGDAAPLFAYQALFVGVTVYAAYHAMSLAGQRTPMKSRLPDHPLRRFCARR